MSSIRNAIYYTQGKISNSTIKSFDYSSKKDFIEAVKSFDKDIQCRTVLSGKSGLALDALTKSFDYLLLAQIKRVYIVARTGESIELNNTDYINDWSAVINIDAILVELSGPSWLYRIFEKGLYVGSFMLLGFLLGENIKTRLKY